MATPADLLATARELLRKPEARTAGLWPRAAALLARQALEIALHDFWKKKRPGLELCNTHAQLVCLRQYWPSAEEAGHIHFAWIGLSRACHHHPYELAPIAEELERWFGVVERMLDPSPDPRAT
jgi:hypothetical protein